MIPNSPILIILLSVAVFFLTMLAVEQRKRIKKLESELLSRSIVSGKVAEQLVPFLREFRGSLRDFRFIGSPIDGIIFGDDEITFVEVKTGNSSLTEKQKRIKKLVHEKRVSWKEVRL